MLTANTCVDGVNNFATAAFAIICDSPSRSSPLNKARPGIVPIMGLPGEALSPVECMAN